MCFQFRLLLSKNGKEAHQTALQVSRSCQGCQGWSHEAAKDTHSPHTLHPHTPPIPSTPSIPLPLHLHLTYAHTRQLVCKVQGACHPLAPSTLSLVQVLSSVGVVIAFGSAYCECASVGAIDLWPSATNMAGSGPIWMTMAPVWRSK